MRVDCLSLSICWNIKSVVDPSRHNAATKTSDIALRHEGFRPIESGSTRDTAPPATELSTLVIELNVRVELLYGNTAIE